MAFIPTVETIGDAALATSIIDRSITELQDSTAVTLQSYSLASCSSLKKAAFSEVTEVLNHSFDGCEALETLDFHATVEFDASALQGLSSLEALILRSDTMCDASSSAVLSYTPIADGTGYIYVPAALEDSYKHDFVWGSYADQIRAIEDYPLIDNKYSWETVQWSMDNGTYATDYAIGDCVPLDLGSEGVVNMQIAAFDVDDLAGGSGKAKISWVSKEALSYNSNATANMGSGSNWDTSTVRATLENLVKPLLNETVASRIVAVRKPFVKYNAGLVTETVSDVLWIPSYTEVYNSGIYTALFRDDESRVKRTTTGNNAEWWLRDKVTQYNYYTVNTKGASASKNCIYANRIVFGFCTN